MKPQPSLFEKPFERWFLLALAAVATTLGGIYLMESVGAISLAQLLPPASPSVDVPQTLPPIRGVSALGQLEPQGEILRLSAPNSLDGSSVRVEQLRVQEGDYLEAGQVVAILDHRSQREAALRRAESAVEVARAQLATVQAGVPQGDIEAQNARIERLKAELSRQFEIQDVRVERLTAELWNVQADLQRYEQLYQEGAIAIADLDTKRLAVATAQKQLQEATEIRQQTIESLQQQITEAQAALSSIAQVRPEEVQLAEAQLRQAIATVEQAQTALEATYIRTPIAGQVLQINVLPGETLGNDGIADIGQTRNMVVVAEVYETDIERIQLGQTATVRSPAISSALTGTVNKIGRQVGSQKIFGIASSASTDNRVIEVEILLDEESSALVGHLSNLQVQVVLE